MTNRAVISNPATGEPVGEVEIASTGRIQAALEAAQATQTGWSRTPRHARYAVMQRFAELLEGEAEPLAGLLSAESGKPLEQTRGEIGVCARLFRGFAERMMSSLDEARFLDSQAGLENDLMITRTEPLGVVAAIIPFNFPVELFG